MTQAKKAKKQVSGKDVAFNIFLYALCILILIIIAYPLYFIIIASFSNPSEVANGNVWFWPSQFTVDGYKELFRHGDIWMGYWNTILYTLVGTLIGLVVNISAAYSLSRKDLVGRKLITFFFIFTMFFNGGLIPTYFTIRDFHLYDTFWVMVLPFSVVVYNIIVARTFFDSSLHKELLDAAQIDGCGNLRFFQGGHRRHCAVYCSGPVELLFQRPGLYPQRELKTAAAGGAKYIDYQPVPGGRRRRPGRPRGYAARQPDEVCRYHHHNRTHYVRVSLCAEVFQPGRDDRRHQGMSPFPM